MTDEEKEEVSITIKEIKISFPPELRPLERIIAGVVEFLEGYYLVNKKEKKK